MHDFSQFLGGHFLTVFLSGNICDQRADNHRKIDILLILLSFFIVITFKSFAGQRASCAGQRASCAGQRASFAGQKASCAGQRASFTGQRVSGAV